MTVMRARRLTLECVKRNRIELYNHLGQQSCLYELPTLLTHDEAPISLGQPGQTIPRERVDQLIVDTVKVRGHSI